MEDDPELINDPERKLEAKVVQQAEKYQGSRVRSQAENKIKAEGRKEIDKLGFRTDAYQSALRVARDLTPAEQKQYVRDFRFFLKVFGDKQQELWPEDAAKAAARFKRKTERKAKDAAKAGGETPEQQERRLAADLNPRSKPKATSAKKPKAGKGIDIVGQTGVTTAESPLVQESGDELIARVAREKTAEQEQRDGEALLATAGKGEPLSQSAQVAAINAKLGLA